MGKLGCSMFVILIVTAVSYWAIGEFVPDCVYFSPQDSHNLATLISGSLAVLSICNFIIGFAIPEARKHIFAGILFLLLFAGFYYYQLNSITPASVEMIPPECANFNR